MVRGTGVPVQGVYTCLSTDNTGNKRTLTIGIYEENGGKYVHKSTNNVISLPLWLAGEVEVTEEIGFTLISELTAEQPQFTLTCISTGGPATTVTWTRDSTTITGGTETVLDDLETAQYTHTLTLTGRLAGAYRCTVSNSIPSTSSTVQNIRGEGGETSNLA